MFDYASKSQYVGGHREKFARLDDLDSRLSSPASGVAMNKCGFEGITRTNRAPATPSRSFKNGIKKGSEGLKSIGRSLGFGVSRAVFPEDLKVSENKILDPQDKFLLTWNKYFVVSCILAVSIDPLFFYLPVFDQTKTCLGIDRKLAITATTLRTVVDVFYLIHMALQFRTAYIAPSSRVFGRGELVIDPAQIATRYLRWYFIIDFLAVVPLPQIVVWRFLQRSRGSDVLATKQALLIIVLLQYIPRFARIVPLTSELKRTAGVIAETAWAGAAYYLLLYMLASHIVGAFWYLLSVERNDTCWQRACKNSHYNTNFLYCGNNYMDGYDKWSNVSSSVLTAACSTDGDNPPFDFGIFEQALSSGIVSSTKFVSKYCYCLWWGLQNLSTLGQGLQTSTYPGESIFSIALAIFGLILFALLIGNMQTYLQSLTIRLEEMRIKRRDSEQWMHHRLLPHDLRERVRKYDQYKWLETRGVDEENLVQNLPKDLRRDIKRHLCLGLVKRVPLFENMDERLLDAICERLKPCLYTNNTYIVREGDPVDEMLFIIRGRLESATTDGGRSGFFNSGFLKEGDFCGEELLTWALDPKSGSNLPSSTRTVKALREVEAFALPADELKFVAGQFRRLHSRQVQHTFRFYSQQWRTWAACFIQAAWRRYSKRKILEQRRKEEEEAELAAGKNGGGSGGGSSGSSYSLGATFLASRFAANALRGVHRNRNLKSARELMKLQKPPEPDFTADAD
ncbi:putative potassium channel, voltage-dependent, EAG/ELK/ERG, rmlC-like jelly roll [Helianthus annuus]|uniref:Potassium channel, voltage-dependent, EAG/ELK/ERG, rmlC-like jelly roll n=3 Tax=Helianthus annuus TaxID=4232 RepID=A0A9K3JCI5_HELAN|nr:probable cyclic nucleotide-gated ion channel 5 isoform X1 [Helianthus annuus]XP_022027595.1 probable cyclic nucleotide-gated ion channel 5 isoform X1 [Helianthus annuus]KAF5813043.1 putative potassium channel, voltage-dependent, EAG/ELK/ERG, rmlC-like jelly roll [Helianthus annuus]KAJ0599208.1 putative IQ motif, EF-hand binding, cyclic nucleotide-binding domain, Ion transport [Helianthus annuus]KAJ0942280.1 putative IQ motif, EF-hand binding, potassium channel, voltage-dependent, EAG/ELK/ERG